MKKIALYGVLFSTLIPMSSYALDKEVDLEIRRVEQRMMRIFDTHEQLLKDVRELQRENEQLKEQVADMSQKYDQVNDQILKFRNVDVANLRAGQKGLYDQIPLFTWGEDTEDCKDIETKHQQTNTQKSADGSQTMRFLCFDGRAMHLGTEYHGVPK
jgi:seryl-tRNA synthetase